MPIFTAIASAGVTALVGATAAATTIGSFAISSIAAGLSFGAQYLIGKYTNRQKKRTYAAFKSDREYGGDVPRQGHFGITASKGHYVAYFKWGSGNAYNADVIVLSDGHCEGLESYILMDGRKINLVAQSIIGNEDQHWAIEGYEGLTSIRYYNGGAGQAADAKLISDTGGNASIDPADNVAGAWNGTDVGANMAYVIFEKKYDPSWEREPEITWIHKGLKLYDPRLDSTVSGGSGSHRLNDPSTWDYSHNPGVQRYSYLAGVVKGGISGRVLIGRGLSASHIDVNSHIATANLADEQRLSVDRYQCNLIAQGDDDHSEILKEFDDAVAGYGVNRGGLAAIVPGAAQVPVLTITSDDIFAEAEIAYSPRKATDQLYNMMTGQFLSADGLFTPASMDPVTVSADVAADKEINQVAYDFLQVQEPKTAQYLLNIRYRQNRYSATATMSVFWAVAFRLNAGDWVTWNNKTWIVGRKDGVQIELLETHADVYSETGITSGPIVVAPTIPANPGLISTVQSFAIQTGFVAGARNAQTPTLKITWADPDDPTIIEVIIEYWPKIRPTEITRATTAGVEAGEYVTSNNVEGGLIYQARATIRTVPDRFKTYTATVETSTATPSRSLDVELANIGDSAREVWESYGVRLTRLQQDFDALKDADASLNMQSIIDKNELSVEVAGAKAAVTTEQSVRASEDAALAAQITAVEASLGDSLANGRLSISATSNPGNTQADISFKVNVADGESYIDSGLYIRAAIDGGGVQTSELIIKTGNFVVTDGTTEHAPFSFSGGVARLAVADIGYITAGTIDLTNGMIIA